MAKILKCIKCTALLLLGYTCLAPGASTVASIVDETSSLRSHQCKATEDDIDVKAIDQTCPSVAETSTNHAPKRKKLEVVTFTAQEEVRSAVLPVLPAHASSTSNSAKSHHKHHNLHKFFTATENIDLQFADRAEVHHITHPSQELMDTFHRLNAQRRLEAGLAPTSTHLASTQTRIVGLTNPPMHCLGLILHSVTHVGIQTFVDGEYPEVHLTLMETEFEATGPQFLVHLFDKIMLAHEDNNTGGKQKAVETIGFTRIWAEPAKNNDDHEDGIIFVDRARLEARIYVPPLLIRLFSMSKQRMERAGSAPILRTIRNDMIPAMDRLVGAYRRWIDNQQGSNVL